jgi:hypothetical protein
MELIHVDTWHEFEQRVLGIKEQARRPQDILFRGQSNACWRLKTTLERRALRSFSVTEYFQLMAQIKPEIEAYTEKAWNSPNWSDPEPQTNFGEHFRNHAAFRFMTHLRHLGFPSPLLDWSRSPYVAAYFAFASTADSRERAIYIFSEMSGVTKSIDPSKPHIISHGGFSLTTHERHFRQQSAYTVCVEHPTNEEWKFASHEAVFASNDRDQDQLIKITLPSSARLEFLQRFDQHNLNEYTLFGSEESLMETLAFREIDRKITR